MRAAAPARDARRARANPSMALTPKEREVLELLARNLSNKEIGLAMQVGEETIKWHMKNLFAKLDAGTRKQVVQRARILGLLARTPLAQRLAHAARLPPPLRWGGWQGPGPNLRSSIALQRRPIQGDNDMTTTASTPPPRPPSSRRAR